MHLIHSKYLGKINAFCQCCIGLPTMSAHNIKCKILIINLHTHTKQYDIQMIQHLINKILIAIRTTSGSSTVPNCIIFPIAKFQNENINIPKFKTYVDLMSMTRTL